jgi:folate-binding Fe-S cluster repair protein YgfZ
LGQETVARTDAFGHVNRLLIASKVDAGRIPDPVVELVAHDGLIGQITSSVWSSASLVSAFA